MKNCLIRFAERNDYEKVESLMKQVQKLHVLWRPDIYKPCDTILSYPDFLDAVSDETMLVAVTEHTVVGLLSFMYRHIASDRQTTRDVLFIDAMVVDESCRQQRIGRQLFDFVIELAHQKHCDGVELQVNAKNTAAYEMYKSCGFSEKSINMELLNF